MGLPRDCLAIKRHYTARVQPACGAWISAATHQANGQGMLSNSRTSTPCFDCPSVHTPTNLMNQDTGAIFRLISAAHLYLPSPARVHRHAQSITRYPYLFLCPAGGGIVNHSRGQTCGASLAPPVGLLIHRLPSCERSYSLYEFMGTTAFSQVERSLAGS